MNEELINVDYLWSNPTTINDGILELAKLSSPQKATPEYRDSAITSTSPASNPTHWLTTIQQPDLSQQHHPQNGSLSSVSYAKSGEMISSVNIDFDVDLIGGSSENVY